MIAKIARQVSALLFRLTGRLGRLALTCSALARVSYDCGNALLGFAEAVELKPEAEAVAEAAPAAADPVPDTSAEAEAAAVRLALRQTAELADFDDFTADALFERGLSPARATHMFAEALSRLVQ